MFADDTNIFFLTQGYKIIILSSKLLTGQIFMNGSMLKNFH